MVKVGVKYKATWWKNFYFVVKLLDRINGWFAFLQLVKPQIKLFNRFGLILRSIFILSSLSIRVSLPMIKRPFYFDSRPISMHHLVLLSVITNVRGLLSQGISMLFVVCYSLNWQQLIFSLYPVVWKHFATPLFSRNISRERESGRMVLVLPHLCNFHSLTMHLYWTSNYGKKSISQLHALSTVGCISVQPEDCPLLFAKPFICWLIFCVILNSFHFECIAFRLSVWPSPDSSPFNIIVYR